MNVVDPQIIAHLRQALAAINPAFLDGYGSHVIAVADRCITVQFEHIDMRRGRGRVVGEIVGIIRSTTPEWTLTDHVFGNAVLAGSMEQFERDVVLFRLAEPV